MIALKRAYDAAEASDGARFLVERLWPRGVRKAELPLDGWLSERGHAVKLFLDTGGACRRARGCECEPSTRVGDVTCWTNGP